MAFAVRFIACVVAAAVLGLAAAGSINDVEHIVIWMQENRPFDHYYGTLKGVRGFNDRTAPPLPNGKPVWYQPYKHLPKVVPLCGCNVCDVKWTIAGDVLKDTIMSMPCAVLAQDLAGAVPPVHINQGEACSAFLSSFRNTSYDHIPLGDLIEPNPVCPSGAKITGLPSVADEVDPAQNITSKYILPFNLQFNDTSAQCMPAPEMAYASDIGIVNGGLYDAWNVARAPGFGMAYFNRTDLPYYYDLMDNFLIGDQYFQSTFTATNPNRLHLFSGSNGLSVPNSGYCQLDDSEPLPGFPWETVGETLQKANVSWQVLQGADNFDDNAFAWFASFRESKPGDPLYDRGMARVNDLVQAFADQVGNDTLPQVTWIVGPTSLSEHATNHPASGEDLSHQLINVLADPANADVYAKTAFIANYDEGGQFFDHLWTPTPPMNATDGKSTVTVDGELTLKEEFGIAPGHPIGLGFRVPFYIVSPWTRGDYTYSEVCDHTSVIQFIEQRFGVHCPNISPWRRAVTGDLTNAFDWDNPDLSFPTDMPVTKNNVNESAWQCEHLPAPTIPTVQQLAHQEAGVRKARALPYTFDITDSVAADGTVTITMANKGTGTGAFLVHDNRQPYNAPRKFTVEGGKTLADTWASTLNKYNISLYGPNGFVRKFAGELPAAAGAASVRLEYLEAEDAVRVAVAAPSASAACTFAVTDNAYNLGGPWSLAVAGVDGVGSVPVSHVIQLSSVGNWYDLTVSASTECGMGRFERRFMGHMENGKDSITDPAMGFAPQPRPDANRHPAYPEEVRVVPQFSPSKDCASTRARMKDACWGHGSEVGFHTEL